MIKEVDIDHDGEISYEEFEKLMANFAMPGIFSPKKK